MVEEVLMDVVDGGWWMVDGGLLRSKSWCRMYYIMTMTLIRALTFVV